MKKIYIKPQIEVSQIETETFLCQSGIEDDFVNETITDQTQILSKDKKYDIWGLDED